MEDNGGLVVLQAPPMPYYMGGGFAEYVAGDAHPNRKGLGFYDLLVTVKGGLHIGENGTGWTLREGDTLLLLPDGEHYAVKPCETETAFYWVHFAFAGDYALASAAASPRAGGAEPGGETFGGQPFANPYAIRLPKRATLRQPAAAFGLLEQLLAQAGEGRAQAYWREQQLLLELLALLESGASDGPISPAVRLAEQAEAYLKRNYAREVTNESLAEAMHFHPNYVVRCMKEHCRCTPMEYLHRYRIEQAKLLLITTNRSVAQIAEAVGFRHAPYFSNCFKASVGQSPLRFRKMYLTS